MAVVKIPIVVKGGLRDTLKYVANDAKTTLHEDDTGVRLVTGIDCSSDPQKAYRDFCRTRVRFGHPPVSDKTRTGYHYILSFPPGEGTPEQVHSIAVEMCDRMWHGEYQILIGTHLDKDHLHCHIVLNAVRNDGKKWDAKGASLIQLREIANDICLEQGLSVIEPDGNYRGGYKHYAYWKEDHKKASGGIPKSKYQKIHTVVDETLFRSANIYEFADEMEKQGYIIHISDRHISIRTPDMKKPRRLDSLFGSSYLPDRIMKPEVMEERKKIKAEREIKSVTHSAPPAHWNRDVKNLASCYVVSSTTYKNLPDWMKQYLKAERELQYTRWRLRLADFDLSFGSETAHMEYSVEQLAKKYTAFVALKKELSSFNTMEEATAHYEKKVNELVAERKRVYRRIEREDDPAKLEELEQQKAKLSAELKEQRKRLKQCKRASENVDRTSEPETDPEATKQTRSKHDDLLL